MPSNFDDKKADAAEYRSAWVLWLTFGTCGGHRFYMGDCFWGGLMLCLLVVSVALLLVWGLALDANTGGGIFLLVIALSFLVIDLVIWIADIIRLNARVQEWQERKKRNSRDEEMGNERNDFHSSLLPPRYQEKKKLARTKKPLVSPSPPPSHHPSQLAPQSQQRPNYVPTTLLNTGTGSTLCLGVNQGSSYTVVAEHSSPGPGYSPTYRTIPEKQLTIKYK